MSLEMQFSGASSEHSGEVEFAPIQDPELLRQVRRRILGVILDT